MDHTIISLKELVGNAKMQLDLLGYAEGTKNHYALKWKKFLIYAEQHGHTLFSKEVGNAFLADHYGIKKGTKLSTSQVFTVRTVTILGELLEHNCFRKCHQRIGKQPPPQFCNILDNYEKNEEKKSCPCEQFTGRKIFLFAF